MNQLFINILTPRPLTSVGDSRLVLESWKDLLPTHLPERFGNAEPLRGRFDANSVEKALSAWKWPFIATRNEPRVIATVFMRQGLPKHAWLSLSFEADHIEQLSAVRFLKGMASRLDADFAQLHLLTKLDVATDIESGTVQALDRSGEKWSLSVTTHNLLKGIPDLYWTNIFGRPYVDLFGLERLCSVPAAVVDQVTAEHIYVQLTADIVDVKVDLLEFSKRRSLAKLHLNCNAFFEKEAGLDRTYNVPRFRF